jgi:hypothetical protein
MSEENLRAELIVALEKSMAALQEEADRLLKLIVRLKEGKDPIQ